MPLSASDRWRLAQMEPHARRHAELLIWEVGAPLRVTSTLRSDRRNRQVGGSPTSFHLRGRAVDLAGDQTALVRAAGLAWAMRVGKDCTGPEEVLLEGLGTSGQHLHVAW